MTTPRFEWEPRKATEYVKTYEIKFEEAKSVFYDDHAKLLDDPDHSDEEERFVLLGLSHTLRVLLVYHCYRGEGNIIRIISARKVTSKESKDY